MQGVTGPQADGSAAFAGGSEDVLLTEAPGDEDYGYTLAIRAELP